MPEHPFQTKRGDIGVNAVCASDAGSVFEAAGLPAQHFGKALQIVGDNFISLLEEVAVGSVDHIGTCQTVVHPLAFLAQRFADGAGEGHDVMACLKLDFLDAVDVERRIGIQFLDIFGGYHTQLLPCLGGKELNFEICAEFVFFGPDVAHHVSAISFYHLVGIYYSKKRGCYRILRPHRHISGPAGRHPEQRGGGGLAALPLHLACVAVERVLHQTGDCHRAHATRHRSDYRSLRLHAVEIHVSGEFAGLRIM